jgi:hypothetical protein
MTETLDFHPFQHASLVAHRIENPPCPQCGTAMCMVLVRSLGLGYDMHSFECAECNREEMKVARRA